MAFIQLMDSLGLNRGGVTRVIYDRLKFVESKGEKDIWCVVTGVQHNAKEIFRLLKQQGAIPECVKLFAFFDDFEIDDVQSARKFDPTFSMPSVSNCIVVSEAGGSSERYFTNDGKFVGLTHFRKDGSKKSSDFHASDSPFSCTHQVEYDTKDRPRRVKYLDSNWKNRFETHFKADGSPLFSAWVSDAGYQYRCTLFENDLSSGVVFKGFHEMRAYMLEEFLQRFNGGSIISDEPMTVPLLKLAKSLPSFKGIAMIHTTHFDGTGFGNKGKEKMKGWVHHYEKPTGLLNHLVFLTKAQQEDFQSIYSSWNQSNSEVIHNITNLEGGVGKTSFSNRLLVLGRIDPGKNVETLVEGFGKALQQLPDVQLDIIGKGSEEESVKKKAKSLGLEKHVHFHGWDEDVKKWYSESDAMLFNSDFEGFGLTILESLSQGTPVITSKAYYGPLELVSDNENGYFTEGTPESISQKIQKLYSDESLLTTMSRAAIKSAETYSKEAWQQKWSNLLEL